MKRSLTGGTILLTTTLAAQAFLFQNLHHFEAPPYEPAAALAMATNGWLYGTTYLGGDHGQGAVFKITTNGTYSNVWHFTGGADGAFPQAALVSASDGNLWHDERRRNVQRRDGVPADPGGRLDRSPFVLLGPRWRAAARRIHPRSRRRALRHHRLRGNQLRQRNGV